jgi:hypothetical protein
MEQKTIESKVIELIMDVQKSYIACGKNNHIYEQQAEKRPFGKVEYIDMINLDEFGIQVNALPRELEPYEIRSCYLVSTLCKHCALNGR